MAIVHEATIKPTKLELIAGWIPSQPWFDGGDAGQLDTFGAFRFDDPAGEVGIQVIFVRGGADGPTYQIPMTYRGEPLADAADALIGEMEHSVLGHRYIYDACHDAVFVNELVRATLTGGTEVVEYVHAAGKEPVALPAKVRVRGSGDPGASAASVPALARFTVTAAGTNGSHSVIRGGPVEVTVYRIVGADAPAAGPATLTGTWPDGSAHCLATVRVDGAH